MANLLELKNEYSGVVDNITNKITQLNAVCSLPSNTRARMEGLDKIKAALGCLELEMDSYKKMSNHTVKLMKDTAIELRDKDAELAQKIGGSN